MAHIDALIEKIADRALREALREQVDTLLHKRSFGLVFQEHKPETVALPDYEIRTNSVVAVRAEDDSELWTVKAIEGDEITIYDVLSQGVERTVHRAELVVVREFGQPIYPGLKSVGRIERGSQKSFNAVINSENYHALETLLYAYEERVSVIYIDPPYNSGARDWKYNNDYVDGIDQYRHSKWLAFMQRRLELAKRLLDPRDSVVVVTIDENEVHHLGMLLEKIFPEATRQLVTIVTNPKGATRTTLSRVEEYAIFCFVGSATASSISDDLLTPIADDVGAPESRPRWKSLLRSGSNSRRDDHPTFFYPLLVDPKTHKVLDAGTSPDLSLSPRRGELIDGKLAIWPVRSDGTWGRWMLKPQTLTDWAEKGFVAVGRHDSKRDTWGVNYLTSEPQAQLASGLLEVKSRDPQTGVVDVVYGMTTSPSRRVKTVWHRTSHDAGVGGTAVVEGLLGSRAFDYPKSVYAVRDTLDMLTKHKPDALILDFFAGSGTTLHAAAMLNAEDGGNRRTILVTNNEVGPSRQRTLKAAGYLPGDDEWEAEGIFRHVTCPRIEASITGQRSDGGPIPGNLRNSDGSPMSDGLSENVEFFELTYEDPDLVGLGRKFAAVAPLLWLKAGGVGPRINEPTDDWSVPPGAVYGVLFNVDQWRGFVNEIRPRNEVSTVFIVTDSESAYQQVVADLPSSVGTFRLYDDYLHTFEINTKGMS